MSLQDTILEAKTVARQNARRNIDAKYPDYAQRNAALGLLSAADTDAMCALILACRDKCNATEIAVDQIAEDASLTDEEKVESIRAQFL